MEKNGRDIKLYILTFSFFLIASILLVVILHYRTSLETDIVEETPQTAVQEPAAEPEPTPCVHEWENGVCINCGSCCEHAEHTYEGVFKGPVCLQCGKQVTHEWENGKCLICGAGFEFVEEELPGTVVSGEGLAESEKGRVITLTYPSEYYNSGERCEKNITVYLPAGYSEQGSYPLLLMCPGSKGPSNYYLEGSERHKYFDTDVVNAASMFDRLIADGLCRPFIAATVESCSTKSYAMDYYLDRIQMAREIPEYILPWLSENYAVCFSNGSTDSVTACRDELAFFGASYGGYICNTAVFQDNYDLFGMYCAVSGGWATGAEMDAATADSELPLVYFYACDGMIHLDGCAPAAKNDYYELEAVSDKLTDGVNGHGGRIYGGDHEISTWLTALFNFVRICF